MDPEENEDLKKTPEPVAQKEDDDASYMQKIVDLSYANIVAGIMDKIQDQDLDFVIVTVTGELSAIKIKNKILDALNLTECLLLQENPDKKKRKKKMRPFLDCGAYREHIHEYFSVKIQDYPRLIMTKNLKYAVQMIGAAQLTPGIDTCLFYQFQDKNGLIDSDREILKPLQNCKNITQFRIKLSDIKNKQRPSELSEISLQIRDKFPRTRTFCEMCGKICKYTFFGIVLLLMFMTTVNIILRKRYNLPV